MRGEPLFPCDRVSRRGFLHRAGGGFLGVALGGILAEAGEIPGALRGPHFPPRAKSVIFLFMCGGVSHIDTFDPKDNKWAGKLIDAVGFGDNGAAMQRPVIACRRTFTRHGESGTPSPTGSRTSAAWSTTSPWSGRCGAARGTTSRP